MSAPVPVTVLLDMNLPRMGGLELLRRIKSDPNLRRVFPGEETVA